MNSRKLLILSFIVIAGITIGARLYTSNTQAKIVTPLVFPKGSTYEKEWKKVDSLLNLGLSKSALAVDSVIYAKAKKEANAPQIIKSVMYRLRIEQQYKEDDVYHSIYKMNDEIKSSSFPVTPILHSMLADIYMQYYQQNRWRFSQRTEVVNVKMDDISTWDLKTLFDQIIKHHMLALQNTDSLQRTKVDIYDEVLSQAIGDGRELRPTLYDFVAHRAVDFFVNEEPDVIRPAYKFELNSTDYFKNYDEFVKINIPYNGDSLSTKYYAIKILQGLDAFHANDADPSALISADLKRLKFVKDHAITGINDSLYVIALQALEKRFIKFPSSTEVSYAIAEAYSERVLNMTHASLTTISGTKKWR